MTNQPPRVLVVDDDDVIRGLISMNFELEGFEVDSASDGQEALEQVAAQRPDVITLDVMMPRLSGLEVADRLRADPATAPIRVVLVSARAQEADLEQAETLGVDAYVTKPFEPDELIRVVRSLLD